MKANKRYALTLKMMSLKKGFRGIVLLLIHVNLKEQEINPITI